MSCTRFSNRALLVLVAFAMAMLAACTAAQQPQPAKLGKLGAVDFPTSCSNQQAQARFLRGVAALQSFWYPVALDEFREATKSEPDCMMGYWGEAMAHNHPIWGDPQETDAARKVLEKIKDTHKLTPREQAYLQAVEILYGEGDKPARDKAYSAAMEQIYRDYPDDAEAVLLYALSLMGAVSPEDPAGVQTRLRAGEIAAEVYRKYPKHPGAAHYILHAYDDPEHAIKALEAARRYAEVAPEAPHALHMPSHIFLQLGMWPEAAASNEASWAASDEWVKEKNLSIAKLDYHSLHWLRYAYLQQGRYGEAEKELLLMQKSLAEGPKDDQFFMGYGTFIYASMASAFVVETERWDAAQKLFEPLQSNPAVSSLAGKPGPYQSLAQYIQALGIFTRGLAAAQKGSSDAQKGIDELQALVQQAGKEPLPGVGVPLSQVLEIQTLEMDAVSNAAKDNMDESIKNMEKAITLEESFPPLPGPPPLIKPSHELFGEILLRAKRPKEAAAQFATSLRRHKNRARSLLGVARAAASDKEREDVRARVLEMGGTVEEHLTTALDALVDGNPGLAGLAASNDYKVSTMEIDIDADWTAILARRQPAAGDLRLVLAMTRITTDLERIGRRGQQHLRERMYLVGGKDIRHLSYEDLDEEPGDGGSG